MTEETWLDRIPEELRGSMAKFDDEAALAKGYMELEAFRGKSLTIPGDDASSGEQDDFYTKVMEKVPGLVRKPSADDAESTANFWKAMGRPEDIDAYPALDGMTPDQTEFMRKAALDANLTKDQFKQFAGIFAEKNSEEATVRNSERETKLNELLNGLGAAKDQKLQAAKNVAQQLDVPEHMQDFSDPDVVSHFVKLAEKIGTEGSAMQQQIGDQATAVMTPLEAEQKIEEVLNQLYDKENPPSLDKSKLLQQRLVQLGQYASPNASTTMASQRAGHGSLASSTRDSIL